MEKELRDPENTFLGFKNMPIWPLFSQAYIGIWTNLKIGIIEQIQRIVLTFAKEF
jgi:hypothetical protein